MDRLRIGEVAKLAGVATSAIRFYEEAGLLPRTQRSASRYRLYDPGIVDRISFIKKAQSLGLKIEEIREILELSDRGRCPCGHVQQVLKAKLAELTRKIDDLNAIRARIRSTLSRSRVSTDRPAGKALCPTIMESRERKAREAR